MIPDDRSTGPADPDPSDGEPHTETLLVVDDSPVDRHLAGALVGKIAGWRAAYAGNGSEALAAIEGEPPAAVLTDLMMPEMDGLQLVEAIRGRYPRVPVILMTAHGSEDVAIQALQRGAASYVSKRSLARDLAGTLRQIQSAMQSDREHRRVLGHLTCLRSQFALENDPSIIPALVAYLQQDLVHLGQSDENEAMRVGIALGEALLNAQYHGNLEVGSEFRQADDSVFYKLAAERRRLAPFRDRRIHIDAECRHHQSVFSVRDEGRGFDPSTLPDPAFPSSMAMASGRGLLLIRTFMDEVTFSEGGKQITMVKRHKVTPPRGTADATPRAMPSPQTS